MFLMLNSPASRWFSMHWRCSLLYILVYIEMSFRSEINSVFSSQTCSYALAFMFPGFYDPKILYQFCPNCSNVESIHLEIHPNIAYKCV